MAKKSNNNEKVQLALEENKWINTPVVYTNIGSNFTRFQQDVMLMVSGQLQKHLKQFLDEGRYKNPEKPKSLFAQEVLAQGIPPVRLYLNDLSIAGSDYREVDGALDSLRELWVKAPLFNQETGLKNGENWYPVFTKIYVPVRSVSSETGDPLRYSKEEGVESLRREGFIDVTINSEIAAYVFDMGQGYINHLERIAFYCNSVYTSRIYLLLQRYVSRGNMHPLIPYMDLKDFLGMFERAEKSDEIINEKYKKYSQFQKMVLYIAKKDMERLAEENKTEIVFDYEPVYRGGKTRGNPECIRFHVKRSALGLAREAELHRPKSEERLVSTLIKHYPTLDKQSLLTVVQTVPDEHWDDFKHYAYHGLHKAVEQPHRWDGTPESFIVFLLKQQIEKLQQPKEQAPVEQDLFSASVGNASSGTAAAAGHGSAKPPVEEVTEIAGDMATEWQTFLAQYDGELKPLLLKARHVGSSLGFMLIEFDEEADYTAFNNAEFSKEADGKAFADMMKLFRKVMGGISRGRIIKRRFKGQRGA